MKPVGIGPLSAHATGETRGFPPAQTAFDFLRHQIESGGGIVRAMFGHEIVAGNFVMHLRFELRGRGMQPEPVQLHTGSQSTRRILAGAANLAAHGFTQFIREFQSINADQNVHRFAVPGTDVQVFRVMADQRTRGCEFCFHDLSFKNAAPDLFHADTFL